MTRSANANHKEAIKRAIEHYRTAAKPFSTHTSGQFTAMLDDVPFTATDVQTYSWFGVNVVIGIVGPADDREYLTIATDDTVLPGQYEVLEEGIVTVGYVVEKGSNDTYAAVSGVANIEQNTDVQKGGFEVMLEAGAPYRQVSQAKYSAVI